MCHTMLGVREASSFVPDIGTTDTSEKRICFANRQYRQQLVVRSTDEIGAHLQSLGG